MRGNPTAALAVFGLLLGLCGCADSGNKGSSTSPNGIEADSSIAQDGAVQGGPADSTSPGPSVDAGRWTPPPSNAARVDPGCTDGQYTETLPNPGADISQAIAAYTPAGAQDFVMTVLQARYPVGHHIVQGGLAGSGNCVQTFLWDDSSADGAISSLSTVVHECGHMHDIDLSFASWKDIYVITDTLTLTCDGGDKFEYGGNTFPRSLLTADNYNDLLPPCPEGSFGSSSCDFYANTYLTGDSGNQGFNTLMEEAVQYINSLATGYAFNDFYGWGTSERDGIMTFLWYIERYLYLARTQHPDTYTFLSGDACWRDLILTVWGRSWLYLETTKDITQLEISADTIQPLVEDPTLLSEIQAIRDKSGCL